MFQRSYIPFVPWKPRDAALALLTVVVVLFLAAGALQLARGGGATGPLEGEVLGMPLETAAVIFQGLVLIGAVIAFSLLKYNAPLNALGFVRPRVAGAYGQAFAFWLAALGVTIIYGLAVRAAGLENLQPPDTASELLEGSGGLVGAVLLAGIWAPLNEELFFRAFMLPGLAGRYGVGLGVLISSGVFAVFHIHPGALIPTFALGVALAMAYVRSGSVLPAIFIHALHNTVVILLAKYAAGLDV